ncbi:MAG: RagB/SusD family nutrient uptake outer membrane protein [Tannerella sp.]|nr:RagB/SusD family nutrient uptake outer membrane protein [Tannerella sp.]
MKRIIFLIQIVLISGSMAMLTSCGEDFLTKSPPATLQGPTLQTEVGVDGLLMGTYGTMVGGDIFGAAMSTDWVYASCAADDAYKGSEEGDQSQFNDVERYVALSDNPYMTARWSWNYEGVTRANNTLEFLKMTQASASPLPATKAIQVEAQAKYLRAWFHFSLNRVFKNISYIRTPDEQGGKAPSEIPNADAGWNEMVADLDFAIANLPDSWDAANVGRATKYSAMTMKAQALMYQNKLSEAKPILDDIINSGEFSLVANYFDNYNENTENNSESIFEIQCTTSGTGNASIDVTQAAFIQPTGPAAVGWGFYQPSQNLVDAFQVTADGLPILNAADRPEFKNDMGMGSNVAFTPSDQLVDLRLDWTVARRGVDFLGWGIFPGAAWIRNHANGGPYMTKKYMHFEANRSRMAGSGARNDRNFRYHRLAHVLLWRAEIAVEDGDLDMARDLVNQIRNRAKNSQPVMGLVTATVIPSSGSVPASDVDWTKPAANYKVEPYPGGNDAFANQATAREAVRMEIRLEFATEGQRFFDLRRWGQADGSYDVNTLNAFIAHDSQFRDFMKGATYSAAKRYWPVPQLQVDIQPGVIAQDPDYK